MVQLACVNLNQQGLALTGICTIMNISIIQSQIKIRNKIFFKHKKLPIFIVACRLMISGERGFNFVTS